MKKVYLPSTSLPINFGLETTQPDISFRRLHHFYKKICSTSTDNGLPGFNSGLNTFSAIFFIRKFYLSFFLTPAINIFSTTSKFINHKSIRGSFFTVLMLFAAMPAETRLDNSYSTNNISYCSSPYKILL
jgi:hypothetical protein